MLFWSIVFFLAGLAVLIKGSGMLVFYASKIAKNSGISEFAIGVTLVAVGTSMPELFFSSTASLAGKGGLALGNLVGANITNIGLVLGISAGIVAIKFRKSIFNSDCLVMFGAAVLLLLLAGDGIISRLDALVLIGIFAYYFAFIFRFFTKFEDIFHARAYFRLFAGHSNAMKKAGRRDSAKLFAAVIVAVAALFIGARLLILGAVEIGEFAGFPDILMGFIVAIGTSSPELSVSISAARKGLGNMLVGNIIGSNIANILLILGIAALIEPIIVEAIALTYAIPAMVAITAILLAIVSMKGKITKPAGLLLWAIYIFTIFSLVSVSAAI